MDERKLFFAFSLTVFAAIAMGIGGVLGFLGSRENKNFFSGALGFAAGVMIYAAFMEILPEAIEHMVEEKGEISGRLYPVLLFFLGMLGMASIEKIFLGHSHEEHHSHEKGTEEDSTLFRMGIMTAIAIGIHNLPEGFAIFTSALNNLEIGLSVTIAIAIHNLAVGLAISAPIYYSTKNKKKAIGIAFLSGISEPLGAFLGYWIFKGDLSGSIFSIMLSIVSGIMVYIAIDELLPSAQEKNRHIGLYGTILGMGVMAITLSIV